MDSSMPSSTAKHAAPLCRGRGRLRRWAGGGGGGRAGRPCHPRLEQLLARLVWPVYERGGRVGPAVVVGLRCLAVMVSRAGVAGDARRQCIGHRIGALARREPARVARRVRRRRQKRERCDGGVRVGAALLRGGRRRKERRVVAARHHEHRQLVGLAREQRTAICRELAPRRLGEVVADRSSSCWSPGS